MSDGKVTAADLNNGNPAKKPSLAKIAPDYFGKIKPDDQRPDLAYYGWVRGEYLAYCRSCRSTFAGDKRAWRCADCAYDLLAKEPPKD